ncbi:ATP-binding protein [Rhizobium sp. Root274]|uniref:cell envelope integrity EipB family protein n=1 Tax=unclassified Rhizobium TaxID=2613769 RepID=UPI00071530B2|nr:ATP-binding protein [Rhizobium sp. Root1240]KRD27804.1 ATP-binding protein [Rhizobium sp. Root274]
MFPLRMAFAATLTLAAGTAAGQAAAATIGLVPHRAVYDIFLKEASDRSGIEGVRGRMVYEFSGSSCKGFNTQFRFVTRIDVGDGVRVTDQRSNTFEDVSAGKFRFDNKSFTDDQLDKDVSGAAAEAGDKVTIELTGPNQRELELANSRFPAEHMLEVIARARKGERVFESRIFDGSEDGDQTFLTTTIVGAPQKSVDTDPEAKAVAPFGSSDYWPVSIAYFDEKKKGDQLPIYSQSFKLYENGVTRDLTLDYGDFVLAGKLTKLEVLGPPNGDCK